MNSDTIADLKQFIEATVSQQLKLHTDDIREDVKTIKTDIKTVKTDVARLMTGVTRLDDKIDDLSAHIGQALHTGNEETGKQLKDHERRVSRLEQSRA